MFLIATKVAKALSTYRAKLYIKDDVHELPFLVYFQSVSNLRDCRLIRVPGSICECTKFADFYS